MNTILAVVIQKEMKKQKSRENTWLQGSLQSLEMSSHTGGETGESKVSLKGSQSQPANKEKVN